MCFPSTTHPPACHTTSPIQLPSSGLNSNVSSFEGFIIINYLCILKINWHLSNFRWKSKCTPCPGSWLSPSGRRSSRSGRTEGSSSSLLCAPTAKLHLFYGNVVNVSPDRESHRSPSEQSLSDLRLQTTRTGWKSVRETALLLLHSAAHRPIWRLDVAPGPTHHWRQVSASKLGENRKLASGKQEVSLYYL